jgi:hypothetical protein
MGFPLGTRLMRTRIFVVSDRGDINSAPRAASRSSAPPFPGSLPAKAAMTVATTRTQAMTIAAIAPGERPLSSFPPRTGAARLAAIWPTDTGAAAVASFEPVSVDGFAGIMIELPPFASTRFNQTLGHDF